MSFDDVCQGCGGMSLYGEEEIKRGLCPACAYDADHPDAKLITLNALDLVLDRLGNLPHDMREQEVAALIGKHVDWHGSVATIARLNDGRIALELALDCASCHSNAKTVYMTSGLHAGAWPYARDITGKYLANLRDQEYVCKPCNAKTTKSA